MANLQITSKQNEGVRGQNYRSITAKLDGEHLITTLDGEDIYSFTDKAIAEVIAKAVRAGFEPVALTVDANGLSEGAKQALTDKYSGDELISSITFGGGVEG